MYLVKMTGWEECNFTVKKIRSTLLSTHDVTTETVNMALAFQFSLTFIEYIRVSEGIVSRRAKIFTFQQNICDIDVMRNAYI